MTGNSRYQAELAGGWKAFADRSDTVGIGGPVPEINIGEPLAKVSAAAVRVLEQKNGTQWPLLYLRGGRLVHVIVDEKGNPLVEECRLDHVRWVLGRLARFVKFNAAGKEVSVPPPEVVVRDVMVTPMLPLPALTGLTEMPVLRPDGTVLDKQGYDKQTGMFYLPPDELADRRFPSDPTVDDVNRALALLLGHDGLLGQFPFEAEADRANLLALLLTPVLRPTIECPAPLCLVDAPTQGTGKGLATDVASVVTLGRVADKQPLDRSESEIRKMLMGVLVAGTPFVVFDNVDEVIRSSALEGLLTAESWADRILGETRMGRAENRVTWAATGNNLHVGGTMARRCYHVRLNAKMARPWTRSDFVHPELIGWAKKNRTELVSALLVLARYWYVRGCPAMPDVPRLGSFQPWADTVGGVLMACGVPGFLGNQEVLYEQLDVGAAGWEAFLARLWEVFGVNQFTASDVADRMMYLSGHLPEELDPHSSTRSIGKQLMARVEQRYGPRGLMLMKAGTHGGTHRYTILSTSDLETSNI